MAKTDSVLWKNLAPIWPKVTDLVRWELGNGEKAKFWHDRWIHGGKRLSEMCLGQLPEGTEEVRVADMQVRLAGLKLAWTRDSTMSLWKAIQPLAMEGLPQYCRKLRLVITNYSQKYLRL
ncbi:hypothetical protein K1719_040184 [Acacia pycnantha]|nr:hypothetical protein K1719_040184 [Acacia pycnantha]